MPLLQKTIPYSKKHACHDLPKNRVCSASSLDEGTLNYKIKLETILEHDDGKFLWFHPRVVSVPSSGSKPSYVLMTMQKYLLGSDYSDYYSGLYTASTSMREWKWCGPHKIESLGWTHESKDVTVAVCDVTPGYHAPTNKILAIGAQVRYDPYGKHLDDVPLAHQTAYAVFDFEMNQWSTWIRFQIPDKVKFNFAYSACAQWVVEPDGSVLLPFYFGPNATSPFSVTVMRCFFDGRSLRYIEHGDELTLNQDRGLCEPSLAHFNGKYYLTIRSDTRGYVGVSDNGLHFDAVKPWKFDDDSDLGSYNTQQHWVPHSEALFLSYTRRDINNGHIMRHRAPLFIAQVDTKNLKVMRSTERILVPERGAMLGNFGSTIISENESWVTVAERVSSDSHRRHGAKGAVFAARVVWSSPNMLA